MLIIDPALQKEVLPLVGPALGALATLLAVVVAGSFNLLIALRTASTQNKQKAREIKLEKLEEIFTHLVKLESIVEAINVSYRLYVQNRCTYKEFLTERAVEITFSDNNGQRLFMLLHMYFPALCEQHRKFQQTTWAFLFSLNELGDSPVDLEKLGHGIEDFSAECSRLKGEICAAGMGMF